MPDLPAWVADPSLAPEGSPDQCSMMTPENNYAFCTREVVARQGSRCANGCTGEGIFDYACAHHLYVLERERADSKVLIKCNYCLSFGTIQYFPIQHL